MLSRPFSHSSSFISQSDVSLINTKKFHAIRNQIKGIFAQSPDTKISDLIKILFSSKIEAADMFCEQPDLLKKYLHIRKELTLSSHHDQFYSSSLAILVYLVILNGHKDLYFNTDGSLNLEKFSDHIQNFFHMENIKIDETNNSALKDITYSKSEGYVVFPGLFTLSREEMDSCKAFRGIRHVAEALPENSFYDNQDGICTGLSYSHQLTMKDRHFNPAQSREFKLAFLEKLRHAEKTSARVRDVLADEFRFQDLVCFEHKRYDENLGHASHSSLVGNLSEAASKILETAKRMVATGVKFNSLMVETTDHALTLEIKISKYNVKFTLYEPNTPEGPMVRYIKKSDLNILPCDFLIHELIKSSFFFKNQYAVGGRNPAIGIFCYSLDHSSSTQPSSFDFSHTDISEISNYDVLNSMLFLAAKSGYIDLVRELLKKNAIDVNYRLLDNGHATPLIIAIHNNHIEIVRMLLESDSLNLNHRMTEMHFHGTALAVAAKKGHKAIVEMLLKKDSLRLGEIYSRFGGMTAAQLAELEGHKEIARLINADPRSPHFNPILEEDDRFSGFGDDIESTSSHASQDGLDDNEDDLNLAAAPTLETPLKRVQQISDFGDYASDDE